MAVVNDLFILQLDRLREKLRSILMDKGIIKDKDATLEELVEAVKFLNSENCLDNFLENNIRIFSNRNIRTLKARAFEGMTSLEKVRIDNCVVANAGCFNSCSNLKHLYLPKLQQIFSSNIGFIYGTNVENLILPELYSIIGGWYVFQSNNLKRIIMPKNSVLGNQNYIVNTLELLECAYTAFNGATQGKMHLIILRNVQNIPTLSTTSIFPNVEEIYITESLVDQLKLATNWSVYADKIKPIEGSKYEDLEWYKKEEWYAEEMSVWE